MAGAYLIFTAEMVNSIQKCWTGVLHIVDAFDSIYLFDSHNKDGNDNLQSTGTVVILKFDKLHSLENYKQSAY